jgi:hypothetical protein
MPVDGQSIIRLATLTSEGLVLLAVVDGREEGARGLGNIGLVAGVADFTVFFTDLPMAIRNHISRDDTGP